MADVALVAESAVARLHAHGELRGELLQLVGQVRARVTSALGLKPSCVIPVVDASFHRTTSGKIQRGAFKKEFEQGAYETALTALSGGSRASADQRCRYTICWLALPEGLQPLIAQTSEVYLCVGRLGLLSAFVREAGWTASEFAASPKVGGSMKSVALLLEGAASAEPSAALLDALLVAARHSAREDDAMALLVLTHGSSILHTHTCISAAGGVMHGGVRGFVGVMRKEHAAVRIVHADIDCAHGGSHGLLLAQAATEVDVAVCPRACHGARLRADPARTSLVHNESTADGVPSGTIGITGGLGGLGLHLAPWLLSHGTERLVVLSRSGAAAPAARLAPLLPYSGTSMLRFVSGDVAEASIVKQAAGVAGPMRGWIHLSDVLHPRPLVELGRKQLSEEFAPKAIGAYRLHACGLHLGITDACVLASSLASFGGTSSAAYSSANAYVGALARWRVVRGVRAVALLLPLLRDVGIGAAVYAKQLASPTSPLNAVALSGSEAVIAICSVMHCPCATIVPLPVDVSAVQRGVRGAATMSMLSELSSESRHSQSAPGMPAPARQTAPESDLPQRVLALLHEFTSDALHVGIDTPFMDAGVDSMATAEFVGQLSTLAGIDFTPTVIFEHSTPRAIASHVSEISAPSVARSTAEVSQCRTRPVSISEGRHRWAAQCTSPRPFLALMAASGDAIAHVPSMRWTDADLQLEEPRDAETAQRASFGSFLGGADLFANGAFGISSAEAAAMDPQQRLLLENGYVCLHASSQRRAMLQGAIVGVFLGVERPDWPFLHINAARAGQLSVFAATADTISVAAGRLSFVLGLQGACETLDTACSVSLVASHAAALELRDTGCSRALVMSVKVHLRASQSLMFATAGMLSIDGRCKTFDAAANGYARAEGVGGTVLSMDASSETHHECLAATTVRHDGRSASLTAPNASAQRELIRAALQIASLPDGALCEVEAHGTGTSLGDPTEAGGLSRALGNASCTTSSLVLGAAKANFGHAEPAAGLLGVAKVSRVLRDGVAFGNAQLTRINPLVQDRLNLSTDVGMNLPTQPLAIWLPERCAIGVSSFGYSGTIAHAIMLEALSQHLELTWASPTGLRYQRGRFSWAQRCSTASSLDVRYCSWYTVEWTELHADDLAAEGARARYEARIHQLAFTCTLISPLEVEMGRLCSTNTPCSAGESAAQKRASATVLFADSRGGNAAVLTAAVVDLLLPLAEPLWLVTCGGQMAVPSSAGAASTTALWGLARAVRCERNDGSVICVDANRAESSVAAVLVAWVRSGSLPLRRGKVRGLHQSDAVEVEAILTKGWCVPRLVQSRLSSRDQRSSICFASVCARLDATLRDAIDRLESRAQIDVAFDMLDQLCYGYVHEALESLGTNPVIPQCHHQWLLSWMRRMPAPADPPPKPEDILSAHPGLWPEIDLVKACGPYLADALTSTVRYQDLLFPEGSLELLKPFYRQGVLSTFYNKGIVAAVEAILAQSSSTLDWRVVEIGAGTGGTATDVLPILKDCCAIYLFTDVSDVFLKRANERFASAYPFVEYALLNVNIEPALQGIAPHVYDLLVATNCLHATPDMISTIHVCRQLLRPSGLMLIHEHPCTTPHFQITFGLTDGWWLFTDHIRREYDSPCMPVDVWRLLLRDAGCTSFHVSQGDMELVRSMGIHSILLAQLEGCPSPGSASFGAVQVITGGLGGLGVLTARLLVREGAQSVALVSRSGRVQDGSERDLNLLRASSAKILLPHCHIGNDEDVRRLVSSIGVVHTERVLHLAADFAAALLIRQTSTVCMRNFGAKVCGGASLHSASAANAVAAFVTFSSYSATVGGIGVAAYLAASSWAESLARYRRRNGHNGHCVSWGEVGGVGIAARRNGELSVEGIKVMPIPLVVSVLERVLSTRLHTLVVAMVVDWSQLERGMPQFSLVTGVKDAMARYEAKESTGTVLPDAANAASRASSDDVSALNLCIAGATSPSDRETRVEGLLLQTISDFIGETSLDANTPLMDAGVDSLSAVELARQLSELSGVKLSSTVIFTYPTARNIARHLLSILATDKKVPCQCNARGAAASSHLSLDWSAVGRWPAACTEGVHLWGLKASCADAMSEVPRTRWTHEYATTFASNATCAAAGRFGGFVKGAVHFDNRHFLISPAEAIHMDPQQRVLLEVGYTALHGAHFRRRELAETLTGVFHGQERPDWPKIRALHPRGNPSPYVASCDTISITAGRLAYALDLRGPCESFNTACSSALTGLNSGRRAMQDSECEQALTASVALKLHPELTMDLASASMLSVDGRCKTFDVSVNGFARSDGVGSVVLLPRQGSAASITAGPLCCSAVQQDGRGASLTAPNGAAQANLLLFVWSRAPREASFGILETHGTGTPLGDPTEVGSFMRAAQEDDQPDKLPVTLGTVKANMGHTECTSGHVGVVSLLLMLRSMGQVGNAKLRVCNPLVLECMSEAFELGQLATQSNLVPPTATMGGVSAFGYSGTIVHVLVGLEKEWGNHPQRIQGSLALERRRYAWTLVADAHENSQHSISTSSPYIPFLGRRALEGQAPGSFVWEQRWSKWEVIYLQDHRVGTVPLLPGVSYVEMVRSMVNDLDAVRTYALTGIVFQNIIFLDDTDLLGAPTIQLRYDREDGQITISSHRAGNAWVTNAEMHFGFSESDQAKVNVDELQDCIENDPAYDAYVDAAEFYGGTGNDYRGEFRMKEGWHSEADGWSVIEYELTMTEHVHLRTCAWMDVGAHAPIWWSQHKGRPYYSAVVGEYRVHKVDTTLNRSIWVQSVSPNGVDELYALSFFDASGECVADIQKGRIGFFDHHWIERRHAQQHVYEVRWDGQVDWSTGAPCHVVIVSQTPLQSCTIWSASAPSARSVEVIFILPETIHEPTALALLHSLACLQLDSSLASPLVVTRGTQGSACTAVGGAGLWGLARAIRHESSYGLWRCLDVSDRRSHLSHADMVPVLVAVNLTESQWDHHHHLHAPRLARTVPIATYVDYLHNLPPMPAQIRRDRSLPETSSTQLYAGSLHGFGLAAVKWLAQGSRVVVTSIHGQGSYTSEVSHLDAAIAARICIGPAPASDPCAILRLLSTIGPRRHLRGLWHGHGFTCNLKVDELTVSCFRDSFAVRADAVDSLCAATQPLHLDYNVLFSSAGALLAQSGAALHSCAYHSACGWVDSFALMRRHAGVSALSVQWGVAAPVIDEMADPRRCGAGFTLVGMSLGLVALKSLLHPHFSAVLAVLPVRWELVSLPGQAVPRLLAGVMTVVTASTQAHPKPSGSQLGTAAPVQQRHQLSLSEVLVLVDQCLGTTVDSDMPLMDAGLDSLGTLELRNQLQHAVGDDINLPTTLVFDHPTARQMALLFQPQAAEPGLNCEQDSNEAGISRGERRTMAIHGLSVLLPGSVVCTTAERRVMNCGCNLVGEVPAARWNSVTASTSHINASSWRHGGFVDGAQLVDHLAFMLPRAEVSAMDPQQRLLLEYSYGALHASLHRRATLMTADCGVFLGITWNEWEELLFCTPMSDSVYAVTGGKLSVASGRLSYVLGVHGPSVTYDTACSAAAVATHAALRAQQFEECSTSLATTVNLMLAPRVGVSFAAAGMTSATGRSHTFDGRADGYARGEACGALVLQIPRDRETIHLHGSAVRHDGRSASLAAPNGLAQRALLGAAFTDAGASANAILLHEMHGTGTILGDPIEARSFAAAVLLNRHEACASVIIGGVKANIGHAEAAAGFTGLLKLVLAQQSEEAPPNAQLRILNPHVIESIVRSVLPVQVSSCDRLDSGAGVTGGVSSFGYSGTIANAILRTCRDGGNQDPQCGAPIYRRLSLVWKIAAEDTAAELCKYMLGWLPGVLADNMALPAAVVLSRTASALIKRARKSPSIRVVTSYEFVALLLSETRSAPSVLGVQLVLALSQLAIGAARSPYLQLLSCSPAHGGVLGVGRVLRLECTELSVLCVDIPRWDGTEQPTRSFASLLRRAKDSDEGEWDFDRAGLPLVPRLRRSSPVTSGYGHDAQAVGAFIITGGLGGLGLRAGTLLMGLGAERVTLTTRSGRITREGQGLAAQLKQLGAIADVKCCDAADLSDMDMLLRSLARQLDGVLHAAGTAGQWLLVSDTDSARVRSMLASKAAGECHMHAVTTTRALCQRLSFSSIASGVGVIGQPSYAAANGLLDAFASSRRAHGISSCSVQWPLITGAGMGASFIAQHNRVTMESISLEQYATQLQLLLAPHCSGIASTVQLVHHSDASALLRDIPEPVQPRFNELVKGDLPHSSVDGRATTSTHEDISAVATFASLSASERLARAQAIVLHELRNLSVSASADTLLIEAGVDSLASTELAMQLRQVCGISLPSALVFEQPTPSALAAVVVDSVLAVHKHEASAPAGVLDTSTANIAVPPPVPALAPARPVLRRRAQLDVAEPALDASSDLPPAVSSEASRVRCLMLHGRAAHADIMRLLMTGTDWHDGLSGSIEFVYGEGPHRCAPLPELYASLVDRGLYDPDAEECFDFGVDAATGSEKEWTSLVEAAVEHVERTLRTATPPCTAIGGICEGSLIAAVVAQRNPDLHLYLNFCGPHWEKLPPTFRDVPRLIAVPSVHILGIKDELFSQEQLCSLVIKCREATVIKHDQGHVVPMLRRQMAHAVGEVASRVVSTVSDSGHAVDKPSGEANHVEQKEAFEEDDGEVADSLRLTQSANHARSSIPLDLLTFVATFFVLLHHYLPWGCAGDEPARMLRDAVRIARVDNFNMTDSLQRKVLNALEMRDDVSYSDSYKAPVCAVFLFRLHKAIGPAVMPSFCMISGLRTLYEKRSARGAAKQMLILFAIGVVYHYYVPGPYFMTLVRRFGDVMGLHVDDDRRLMCGDTSMAHVFVSYPWWSWYFFLLAIYKAVDAIWLAAGLPTKCLALLSVACYWACAGAMCPHPFCLAKGQYTQHRQCNQWLSIVSLVINNRHRQVFDNLFRLCNAPIRIQTRSGACLADVITPRLTAAICGVQGRTTRSFVKCCPNGSPQSCLWRSRSQL